MVSADSDLVVLQVGLVSLSIRMIADGLPIDVSSALKLKNHAFSLFGFKDVAFASSGPNGHAFYVKHTGITEVTSWSCPCLSDLTLLFDSSHTILVAPAAMGSPYASEDEMPARLLIGSIFVDILLDIFVQAQSLESLPPITLKNMLKALTIIIYKHDFDSKPLRHLQVNLRRAVRRTLDLLLDRGGLNYELRQLCLTVCQAFIKAWPNIVGVFLWYVSTKCLSLCVLFLTLDRISDAVESMTKVLQSLNYEQNVDDPLVEQTKIFLEANLLMCVLRFGFVPQADTRRTQ